MSRGLSLADQAVECFGKENQIKKAVEEFSEAAAALMKLFDVAGEGFSDANIEKAIEEIADAEICLDQLHKIFDSHAIAKIKWQKEGRLFDTICRVRNERAGERDRVFYPCETARIQ